jgi:hypothetical protein
MKSLVFCFLLVATSVWFFNGGFHGSVELSPGVHAPEDPDQGSTSTTPFRHGDYTVEPLASFELKAKVLSRKDYYLDREAEISPVDLALGWGPMSDQTVVDQIEISQRSRWYHWKVDQWPIPRREIEINSANMHMIPANDMVENELKKTRKGDIIELSGKLVKVSASDGWRWKSSLTRNDTGGGACELIFVEKFRVITL